jgi:hypothetical protein
VNCIAKARGELLVFGAENIGHALKMLGLVTQRLGKDGRGIVVDQPALACAHELGQMQGVSLGFDDTNLHFAHYAQRINELCRMCRLCTIILARRA